MLAQVRTMCCIALAAALLTGRRVLAAQDTAPPRPALLCFRGAPADRCRWFTLTEGGIHYRLTDVAPNDDRLLYGVTVGFMVNTSRRAAIGAEAFGGVEGVLRGGVALRWRRWLGRRSSLDVALGVHLFGDTRRGSLAHGSPMLQARLNAADLLAASARLDLLRLTTQCADVMCLTSATRTSERLYVGGEVGSQLGLGTILAAGVGGLIYFLSTWQAAP